MMIYGHKWRHRKDRSNNNRLIRREKNFNKKIRLSSSKGNCKNAMIKKLRNKIRIRKTHK